MSPRIVYCHGFGSSPQGRKAVALRAALEPEGFVFAAPDLNVPTFERMDWDTVVARAVAEAEAAPTDVVVGSSLGALVALETARRVPAPAVLVVPVLGYGPAWAPEVADGDPVVFFDAGLGRERSIHRAFVETFLRGPAEVPPPPRAVTVIAGRHDRSVRFEQVRAAFDRWAASGALAHGSEMIDLPDGDHALAEFTDVIADAVRRRARGDRSARGPGEP